MFSRRRSAVLPLSLGAVREIHQHGSHGSHVLCRSGLILNRDIQSLLLCELRVAGFPEIIHDRIIVGDRPGSVFRLMQLSNRDHNEDDFQELAIRELGAAIVIQQMYGGTRIVDNDEFLALGPMQLHLGNRRDA